VIARLHRASAKECPTVRSLLTALALLVAAVMLYQGLALTGLVEMGGDAADSEVAASLLIAGGAMLLAAVTLRRAPGIAAIEMLLAGCIAIVVADPTHRYLTAYGIAALVLAVAAMISELGVLPQFPPRRVSPSPSQGARRQSPPVPQRQLLVHLDQPRPDQQRSMSRQRQEARRASYRRLRDRIDHLRTQRRSGSPQRRPRSSACPWRPDPPRQAVSTRDAIGDRPQPDV
jgi:hypothetical protein